MNVPPTPLPFGTPDGDCGDFGYRALDHWAQLPAGWDWIEVVAVATDSLDRVFVFCRGEHPVLIFESDGTFIKSWGEGQFVRPHGLTIAPDDSGYFTDDVDHSVRKFTRDGQVLLTLGTRGHGSDTGATSLDYRTIKQAAGPFHYPTNLALSPKGELYVSDGYGNARVHKFSADGKLLLSWGGPGDGPGQFHVPHGIAVTANGTVYVADRENSRIQLFSPEGVFITQWTDLVRPSQIFIDREGHLLVAELGWRAGLWAGNPLPPADASGGRVSIFRPNGDLIARWGGGRNPGAAGDFFAPHGICSDSRGDIYVCEVVKSARREKDPPLSALHSLQKFVKTSNR